MYYSFMEETHLAAIRRLGYALSDPTRVQILYALCECKQTPGELLQTIGGSKQLLSNQLRCLRGCDLISGHKQGRRVLYELQSPELKTALNELLQITLTLNPCCCQTTCESDKTCRCLKQSKEAQHD